jgi:oxygen-independent coproporphyrinogen-3 oxidase
MMASLYVHIPFCERKCVYCDFYSVESSDSLGRFLDALRVEAELYREMAEGSRFETLFLGGGTPSLLSPLQMEGLLGMLRSAFWLAAEPEITVETNPGTVDREKLAAYRSLGVNRLSIGIQSFHDEELQFLGRIHDPGQAARCVEMARETGFGNVSVDLIYSLPGQSAARWESTLRRAVGLGPDHISAYSLIVEEHTPLARSVAAGRVVPNSAEAEAGLYEQAMRLLAAEGFEHYEVSNYARPGFRCAHNLAYWTHVNYLGLGPSAHSFWRAAPGTPARRWWNVANVTAYCERLESSGVPVASEEQLDRPTLLNEAILLGLRAGGIDQGRLRRDLGFELSEGQRRLIASLEEEGLATSTGEVLALTDRGYLLCDEIVRRLFV